MAGSYHHLHDGWSSIENMGDAYECVEELFWLVEKEIDDEKLEKLLKEFYAMQCGEIPKDEALLFVESRMES